MDTHKLIDGVGLAIEAVTSQTEAEFVQWVRDTKAAGNGFPWNDEQAKQVYKSVMDEVNAPAAEPEPAATPETPKVPKKSATANGNAGAGSTEPAATT